MVDEPGSCEAITIIQSQPVENNTRCTVLLSAGMCHTTTFNSVLIERSGRSAGDLKAGAQQLAERETSMRRLCTRGAAFLTAAREVFALTRHRTCIPVCAPTVCLYEVSFPCDI